MEDGVVMQLYWDCQELGRHLSCELSSLQLQKVVLSTNGRRGGDAAVLGLPGAADTAGGGNSSCR
jgi:hypothetical protein